MTTMAPRDVVQRYERRKHIRDGTDVLVRAVDGYWYFGRVHHTQRVEWSTVEMQLAIEHNNWKESKRA